MTASASAWPPLPLAGWAGTYDTLNRWLQIVGKTMLGCAPPQNHWWHAALHLTARGLGTGPLSDGTTDFDIEVDFLDHALLVRTRDGRRASLPLRPQTVAEFYQAYRDRFAALGIRLDLWPVPSEMIDRLRFDQDRIHAEYDGDAVQRCWRVLARADRVLKQFRGRFLGKCSPSHFWWGGFDLACTRFSGRRAPPHPGGIPNIPDFVNREAYSHECISVGWWPGRVGMMEEPVFYAYAYPEPDGCAAAPIQPAAASYHATMHEWILPYEAMRRAADPDAALLQFCQSTYAAAADLGGWDRDSLERNATELQA